LATESFREFQLGVGELIAKPKFALQNSGNRLLPWLRRKANLEESGFNSILYPCLLEVVMEQNRAIFPTTI
jgi:hypothetical protein